ncbi:methyltransferase domain-containing protein [Streptomyces sp. NPDC020412]|uniref:class I SAM-dependent methyltransferase n=1 Tax=Streptomyces sp. NPDC020412 TaxID=3365073 RepID=UPI0037BD595F
MADPVRSGVVRHLARVYDEFHTARASTHLVAQLYAQAMGEDYPEEITPSSSCDWPLIATLIRQLKLRPNQRLLDLGCGTGGIGLWLARALHTHLTGIDISPQAVRLATQNQTDFLPPNRAAFRTATLDHTGLPDQHANGAVCIDAFTKALNPTAALREFHRVLRPGARIILTTAGRRPDTTPRWPGRAAAAGLELEDVEERPSEPAMWRRVYRLWLDHEDDLRRHVGAVQAQFMVAEARRTLPTLADRRAVVVTLRRPADGDRAPYATA